MSKQAKVFSVVVLLLLMLSSFPTAALAYSITTTTTTNEPPRLPARFAENDSSNFVLLSAYYTPKGPLFTFQVNGHVNKEDLRAAVLWTSSKEYKINCVQTSETIVICSAPKNSAGKNGVIYLAGFGTWLQVPEAREFPELPVVNIAF